MQVKPAVGGPADLSNFSAEFTAQMVGLYEGCLPFGTVGFATYRASPYKVNGQV